MPSTISGDASDDDELRRKKGGSSISVSIKTFAALRTGNLTVYQRGSSFDVVVGILEPFLRIATFARAILIRISGLGRHSRRRIRLISRRSLVLIVAGLRL
jgi:hypothetical protein